MDKIEPLDDGTLGNKNKPTVGQANNCGLSAEFWKGFAKSNWEKETFVQKKHLVVPPISEDYLFNTLVDMCNRVFQTDSDMDLNLRVFVDGIGLEESDVIKYCPKKNRWKFWWLQSQS